VTGSPKTTTLDMNGDTDDNTEGYAHQHARFKPNRTYRISIAARGTQTGATWPNGASYVAFESLTAGTVRFGFTPGADWSRITGSVTLGNATNYRLVVGTERGTTLSVANLAIVEAGVPFGFGTYDERRSWEYIGGARPTAWGVDGQNSFAGVVVGPCPQPQGWGLRNRYVALRASNSYRISFVVRHVAGALGPCTMWIQNLAGEKIGNTSWQFATAGERRTINATLGTNGDPANTITFGTASAMTFMVGDIALSEV
jgi:hypothetical protein